MAKKNQLFSEESIKIMPHCQKPGALVYCEDWAAVKGATTTEQRGQLIDAVMEYTQYGVLPDFEKEPVLKMGWGFLLPKLNRDQQGYNYTVYKNRYSAYKRDQEKPLEPDQWLQVVTSGDQWELTGTKTVTGTETVTEAEKGKETGEGEDRADKPPAPSCFTPPSVDEVSKYCAERRNYIDPEKFVSYYESIGWKMGKGQPIKDWRAVVRLWEKREEE